MQKGLQPKVNTKHCRYRDDLSLLNPDDLEIKLEFDEMRAFSQISSNANIPWTYKTFLDHNHTVGLAINGEYHSAVLIADKYINAADIAFLKRESVNLLWIVPVTDGIYSKLTAEPSDYSDVEQMVKAGAVRLEKL